MSGTAQELSGSGVVVNGSPEAIPLRSAEAAAASTTASTNGQTPTHTPSHSGLSRSESVVNLATAVDDKATSARKLLPEEFILPNGHPDVRDDDVFVP